MRRSELYSLEWDRVDLERRQLHLLKTKNGTARVVILTEAAVSAIKELWEHRSSTSPQVCLTRYGEPMVSPRAWFELVMQEAVKKNSSLQDVKGGDIRKFLDSTRQFNLRRLRWISLQPS
jgi:integrase